MKPLPSIQQKLFNTVVLDIKLGREGRDLGMSRAEKKANKDVPGFSQKAFEFLVNKFLPNQSEPFLAEEVRAMAAVDDDFELPDNGRAWGKIFVRARNENIIVKIGHGTVKNAKAHRCFSTLWRKS